MCDCCEYSHNPLELTFPRACDVAINLCLADLLAFVEEVFRGPDQSESSNGIELSVQACNGLAMLISGIQQTIRFPTIPRNSSELENVPNAASQGQ